MPSPPALPCCEQACLCCSWSPCLGSPTSPALPARSPGPAYSAPAFPAAPHSAPSSPTPTSSTSALGWNHFITVSVCPLFPDLWRAHLLTPLSVPCSLQGGLLKWSLRRLSDRLSPWGPCLSQALEDLEGEALEKGWTENRAGILRQATLPTVARQTGPCSENTRNLASPEGTTSLPAS